MNKNKIFFSYSHSDKQIVKPIADRFEALIKSGELFFDEWSMQPGDSITEKLWEGLNACQYFFYFVSKNSIDKGIVKLEWQTALIKSYNSQMKFIPIRIEDIDMPLILRDKVWIDVYSNGLEFGIRQIFDVINERNNFQILNQQFQNVTATVKFVSSKKAEIKFHAKHFIEPSKNFIIAIVSKDGKGEIKLFSKSSSLFLGKDGTTDAIVYGTKARVQHIGLFETFAPKFPIEIIVETNFDFSYHELGVLHEKAKNEYQLIYCLLES